MRRAIICGLALLVCAASLARAQALADKMPADALVYVGWSGSHDLGPDFENSHWKAVLDRSEFGKLMHEAMPQLVQRVWLENPMVGHFLQVAAAIAGPLWEHPSALYFGGFDMTDPDHPNPRAAILCDAGDDAAAMTQMASQVVALGGESLPLKISVQTLGTMVVISTCEWPENPASPLSQDSKFQAVLAKLAGKPVSFLYVDFEKISATIDQFVQASKDPSAAEMWPKIKDALGLDDLKRLGASDCFSGRDFRSQIFLESPGPRVGLASLMEGEPLDSTIFQCIPPTATMACAGRLDLANVYRQVRIAIRKISADADAQVDQAMQRVNGTLGMDFENDLLAAAGTEWAGFVDPTVGDGPLCAVLVNHPPDAAKLAASLTKLEDVTNAAISGILQPNAPFLTIQFRREEWNGITIHFAALPIVTPSWASSGGNIYIGLYPQIVASAVSGQAAAGGKSILDNPDYQDFRTRLGGPSQITQFSFMNTPKVASRAYGNLLLMTRLFLGAGDLVGLESPAMVIPPLASILPDVEPQGNVAWQDADGFYVDGIESFPGESLLANQGDSLMPLIQGMSSALPAIQKAREN